MSGIAINMNESISLNINEIEDNAEINTHNLNFNDLIVDDFNDNEINLDDALNMDESSDDEINIEELLKEIESAELNDNMLFNKMIEYNENYTVKELLLMCDYYGFAKELKLHKYNKLQIIEFMTNFEADLSNNDIVHKRKTLWFYIDELKNDKFMKKYVLW